MDLKSCRCLVVDEADAFFYDEKTFGALKAVVNYPDIKNRDANNRVQRILFSATYESQDAAMTDAIQQKQAQIVQEAHQIMVKAEKLKLDHIHQCVFTCEPGKKLEFVKEIFETCETT
jgi:superfamily II DNA/RNA helicase